MLRTKIAEVLLLKTYDPWSVLWYAPGQRLARPVTHELGRGVALPSGLHGLPARCICVVGGRVALCVTCMTWRHGQEILSIRLFEISGAMIPNSSAFPLTPGH